MKNEIKFLILIIALMSCSFLYSQETLEEIVTWELDEGVEFRCQNLNNSGSDLNNDGYDDFIHWYPGDPYRFQFFMGNETPNPTYDFEIEVPFGSGIVSWGGDLNSDDYKDIVYTVCTNWGDPGDIYICLGSENIDLEPELVLHGEDYAPDPYHLGFTGINAGYDFNGDGYNDILAGGEGDDYTWRGMVAIFFGGEELDSEADFHLLGNNLNQLGKYKTAGDINGDGFDDLIMSRNTIPELDSPIKFEIYLGGPNMDTVMDYELEDTFFYESPISSQGDFNGDGFDDIIISTSISPNFSHPYIFIYYGNIIGNFSPAILVDSLYSSCIYYSKINQDSYNDLIVRSYDNTIHYIDIYYGNNEEDYIKDISIPYTFYSFYSISCNAGDFNGDNEYEILINTGDSGNSATMYGLHGGSEIDNCELKIMNYELNNFPNPFNPVTTISYDLPVTIANPVIEIFNIKGEKIETFNCQNQMPIIWDGTDNYQNQVSSGVYLYRLKSDEGVLISKKMLLLK